MKTDFSSLRTPRTDLSPLKRAESSPLRQTGASSFGAGSPVRQTQRTDAVQQSGVGGYDAVLARQGANTLERILSRYGSGSTVDLTPVKGGTSTSSPSDDPFQRLDTLTRQVNDLFQKDPSVIEQIRADKQLSTSIQRIAKAMLSRIPGLPPEQGNIFRSYAALAREIDPIEPKPILP